MADFNKDEANKALEIAIENTKNEKYDEALKSANEARLMNPELPDIKRLVTLLQVLSANPDVTHYEILGVEETANENEIRSAFRKLAVNLNPDTNNFPKASEAFRRISEAMSVLSNDRTKYDNDLALAREVAEIEAVIKDFAFDLGACARVATVVPEYPWAVAEWKAPAWTFDGMISSSEHHQAAFQQEKAFFEALHGRDFLVDRKARGRTVAEFEAMIGKDFVVAPEFRARFDVFDTLSDGMISSSELQAALEAYDTRQDMDAFFTESLSSINAKEPQSTTHHPSFQKRFVCSSNEVAGRGTKRSNTTQSTLTHPMPKKKMDGQGPLFFK